MTDSITKHLSEEIIHLPFVHYSPKWVEARTHPVGWSQKILMTAHSLSVGKWGHVSWGVQGVHTNVSPWHKGHPATKAEWSPSRKQIQKLCFLIQQWGLQEMWAPMRSSSQFYANRLFCLLQLTFHVTPKVALLLLHVTWTTPGDSHWLRNTCKTKHLCFSSAAAAQPLLSLWHYKRSWRRD